MYVVPLIAASHINIDFADAHVYGAFNLAYGIGSSVGPVVGGQVFMTYFAKGI